MLQEAMLTAEHANTAKKRIFIPHMSHEIRTPMNAIIGMTTIAAASVKDPARGGGLPLKNHLFVKHLLMLINDVLDMAKIESNKMMLQNEPFDIFEVINGYVSAVYAQAKAKGVAFQETMEGSAKMSSLSGIRCGSKPNPFFKSRLQCGEVYRRGQHPVKCLPSQHEKCCGYRAFFLSDTGIGMTKRPSSASFSRLSRPMPPFPNALAAQGSACPSPGTWLR